MKSIILTFLSVCGICFTSSCTTVEQKEPTTQTTTTTEHSTMTRPYSSSVETQTTRTN